MARKDYADPRWQRVRLRIMERDQFACKCCGDATSELQVHHLEYEKGKRIWESKDVDLITLCHNCHESVEMYVTLMRRHAHRLLAARRDGGKELETIVRALLEAGK
jgi:5-methylcytosine-specific restriction endonuclease McrA